MDPQQYPNGHNPYDFILNPAPQPKPAPLSKLPGGNNPLIVKIVIIVGGAFVLIIALSIIMSMFNRSDTVNSAALLNIAQTQNEIARVADQGLTNATQQNVKNLSVNTKLAMRTQQQLLIAYMGRNGIKVSSKQLTFKQDAQTDQKFTLAKQTSTFDVVFSQTVQSQLEAYATSLKQLFGTATGENQRTLLSTDYTQTQLLISQVPSTSALQGD
jgi:hypothetical protein